MVITKEIEQDGKLLVRNINKLLRDFAYKHELLSVAILPKNHDVGLRIQKWEFRKYNEYKWI